MSTKRIVAALLAIAIASSLIFVSGHTGFAFAAKKANDGITTLSDGQDQVGGPKISTADLWDFAAGGAQGSNSVSPSDLKKLLSSGSPSSDSGANPQGSNSVSPSDLKKLLSSGSP